MTEPHKMQLRIPPGLYQRLEDERARRLKAGGIARPVSTAIILDALNAYLAIAEKKAGVESREP